MTDGRVSAGSDAERGDAHISELYGKAGKERAGARLDQNILKLAARNARSSNGRLPAWLKPAAVAVSVGLCLGVVLQFDGTHEIPIAPVTGQPDNGNTVTNFEAAAEGSSQRIRSIGENASSIQSPGDPTAASLAAPVERSEAVQFACDSAQTRTAELWQSCIDGLRRDGRLDDARLELERLGQRFPE